MSARTSSRVAYSRVGGQETDGAEVDGATPPKLTREQRRLKRSERAEQISTKLHSALWSIAALVCGYFTDFINVCISSTKVNRFWFNAGVVCFSISAVLVLYMAIWVPRVLKIQYEPQVYSPRLLPATGAFAIISGILLIIGLWPVYGFFTPGILFVIWFGSLMITQFLPAM